MENQVPLKLASAGVAGVWGGGVWGGEGGGVGVNSLANYTALYEET